VTRALVVDDSRAMRSILQRILQELGFEVEQACHGKEALALLRAGRSYGLALVDWNMPEMNGLELVRAVRAEPAWNEMAMVMVTTESELDNVSRALEAGANEYVMKPFTVDVMRDKLGLLGMVDG
jgi:two-component system chemotaxis response regulator CheY